MKLYKNVLHHNSNTLPKWFLESIGMYVSLLNKCAIVWSIILQDEKTYQRQYKIISHPLGISIN